MISQYASVCLSISSRSWSEERREKKRDLTELPEYNINNNEKSLEPARKQGRLNTKYQANTRPLTLPEQLEIFVDGPFGSPSSNIYRAEHAVLVGTGIGQSGVENNQDQVALVILLSVGITPFASILQSIMHRYWSSKATCPQCSYTWTSENMTNMFNLKKVDFFWINRDHTSFEWFVNLLSPLEIEQQEQGGHMKRFLDMHMYVTSALQRNDMKAVALQMALDILHKKEERDLITGKENHHNTNESNLNN